MKNAIRLAKGVAIGCCNVIPGVSGGTAAVILGVFDELVGSVNGLFKDKGRRLTHLRTLLPLLLGVLIGLLSFARLVSLLFERYPALTLCAFSGMVAGSLPMLYKRAMPEGFRFRALPVALVAMAMVLLFEYYAPAETSAISGHTPLNALILGFCEMLAAAAMVIPGISGSFVMLLLGQYPTAMYALSYFDFYFLIPLLLGALCGIVLISRLLGWLMRRAYAATYAAILGFVAGALVTLSVSALEAGLGGWNILFGILLFAGGACLTYFTGEK